MPIKQVKLTSEVSLLFDMDGIELYLGEAEMPANNWSLEELIDDFIESRVCMGQVSEVDRPDVKQVRKQLKALDKKLKKALKGG